LCTWGKTERGLAQLQTGLRVENLKNEARVAGIFQGGGKEGLFFEEVDFRPVLVGDPRG